MNQRGDNLRAVGEKWKESLRDNSAYEHHVSGYVDCKKLKRFHRVWRKIFRIVNFSLKGEKLSVLEVGCGGGKYLANFALNGWRSVGVDVSNEVLGRAKNYLREVENVCHRDIDVDLIHSDLFDLKLREKFDIVFHAGVVEHFLDSEVRMSFIEKMFELAKNGGYVISIVPSGTHPLREKMRRLRLGGYEIPEVDYTPSLMTEEYKTLGMGSITILPHNLFSYFLIDDNGVVVRFLKKIIYYFFQIIPAGILPESFAFRHAGTLIAIGQK